MSQPGHDASKVRASGPGLDTKGVPASLPVEFTIDARDAGEGLLTVQILVGFGKLRQHRFRIRKAPPKMTCCYLLLGPRGEAKERNHPGQQGRHLHCVLRARLHRPLHYHY